jgi:hypothetical protein
MLRRRWIGIVLRVLPVMIVYYAAILMSSFNVNFVQGGWLRVLREWREM